MALKSKIEWTESSWNPVTGCTKVSPGCSNCYAERLACRLKAMGNPNYYNGFEVTLHKHVLDLPLKWKKPQTIFVNSMSDLFHEDVPFSFIDDVFSVMKKAWWHTFQILTKRSERLLKYDSDIEWPENVWMGVSVENDLFSSRINHLKQTNAPVKFISFEPLIGPISNIDIEDIDWVIVGGESGPHARQLEKEWVCEIRDICLSNNIPFFFKQWGGFNKKRNGRLLEGKIWEDIPIIETQTSLL